MSIKIGLECHMAISNVKTKMFCGCPNDVNKKPNSICCPTCLGFPGSKPMINEKVIISGIKVALAFNCKIQEKVFFSRKQYFYNDLPKGYQITQYSLPLGKNGFMELKIGTDTKKINIQRVHIEEDPGKLIHVGKNISNAEYTLIDYNRSGIPLCEIVTDPDIKSPKEAKIFLQKLSNILEYLGVFDSNRDASLRVDANISTLNNERVEIKNITSFKDVEAALNYETVRQKNLIDKGERIIRETRSWDPVSKVTVSLRNKEEESEYGYIFEPDLTEIEITKQNISNIQNEIPELPEKKIKRFIEQYKLNKDVVESLAQDLYLSNSFEEVSKYIDAKTASAWFIGPIKKTLNWNNLKFKDSEINTEWITYLLEQFKNKKITDKNTEIAIRKMIEEKKSSKYIIDKYKLEKIEQKEIINIAKKVLEKNKKAISEYKNGKEKTLEFLIGQVIKESHGKADANDIRKLLKCMIK